MVKMAESPFNWFVEMVGPARFELATSKTLRLCFQLVTTFSRRKKWPKSGFARTGQCSEDSGAYCATNDYLK